MSAGEVIAGRFAVEALELGRGSTGIVYAAIEVQTGRRVAVKALHPWLVEDPVAVAGLRAEATLAGRLRHPSVVGVLGLWQHGGRSYLVSDRVEGASLAERHGAPLDHDGAMVLGIQLAEALAAAHAVGLVHGDVRPGNVLLGHRGLVLAEGQPQEVQRSIAPRDEEFLLC